MVKLAARQFAHGVAMSINVNHANGFPSAYSLHDGIGNRMVTTGRDWNDMGIYYFFEVLFNPVNAGIQGIDE
jgi:hypothetical protein